MASPNALMISVQLAVVPLSTQTQAPVGATCLGCGSSLELHQPDGNAPQRLLGTCDDCGRWHLIDCDASALVLLPDVDELRDAEPDR